MVGSAGIRESRMRGILLFSAVPPTFGLHGKGTTHLPQLCRTCLSYPNACYSNCYWTDVDSEYSQNHLVPSSEPIQALLLQPCWADLLKV